MATTSKQDAIFDLGLKFWIDEGSLVAAMSKAQARYMAQNENSRKMNRNAEAIAFERLRLASKETHNIIARERKVINDKAISNETKAEDKALKQRRARIQKEWNERGAIRKRELNKSISDEKKAANEIAVNRKKSFSGGFDNFGGKIGTISSYGAAIAIINAVRQAITYTIGKVIEFEKSFTDLAVKSGYSNQELANVSKTIYDVAASTKFSTLEIIEAATALGKLGFEAVEVMEILPNVANVAGATGESLQSTAEIFGKVMNAYSLAGEQSQYVADLMVDTFNNSALSMEKFNTAFSYVGAAAASTGTSLTELTKAMAILSDKGVTASKIGTGLRNVFTKLGREGDTLRSIIARVNEENLSFYEIAELVGRRAANQLFILMDDIGEFDKAIADSVNSFGAAWEANAKQMSTFSAKFDIFINNVTNKAAGLEFDADETFRQSLMDSIDLMTKLNALKLFNKDGADIAVFNIATQDKEFLQLLSETEKRVSGKGKSREANIKNLILKEIESKYAPDIVKEVRHGSISNVKGAEHKALAEGLRKEIIGLNEFFNLSDGDSVLGLIEKFNKGVEDNKLSILKEQYQSNLTSIVSFVSQFKTETTNAFNDAIKNDDESAATAILQTLIDRGLADEDRMKVLKKVFENSKLLTEDMAKSIRNKNYGSGFDSILETGRRYVKLSKELSADTNKLDNVLKDDVKRFEQAIEDRKSWENEMCAKAKTDSSYQRIVDIEGIKCDSDKTKKKKKELQGLDPLTTLREDYKTRKDLLTKELSIEKDPIKQVQINDQLIYLEKTFREKLLSEYDNYLNMMAVIRSAFIAKNPDQTLQFDNLVKKTEEGKIKETGEGDRNNNTYYNRNFKAKADAYKQDALNKATYLEKMSALDLSIRKLAKRDTEERKKLLKEKNDISTQYYIDAEQNLSLHFALLSTELEAIQKKNEEALGTLSPQIDVSDLLLKLETYKTEIKKLREEANKAQGTGKNIDKDEKNDYFDLIMEMSENLYNVYAEIGDRKLELIKEQTDRELEIIQSRFDREGEMRSAALNAGIISQEQATEAEERATKQKIDRENKANKKLFEAQKKRDKEDAIFQGLTSTAQAISNIYAQHAGNPVIVGILTGISAAAIAASTALNVGAISSRKFVPQTYADGGLIEGKSHAQGGVPFTVAGRGGFEAEGGEFIVNKEATKRHLSELQRMNSKKQTSNFKFATGGSVNVVNESDAFNAALLAALSKPVRAFVTSQDLAKSESERNALSKKVSY